MKYIKVFEDFESNNILLIVDIQKSFRKFFSEMYLHEVKKYCKNFDKVYQIWDNHVDGTNVDKDYLYDENPDIPIQKDLYQFPNQVDIIEKRYNYDVDANFYKKILDKDVYLKIKDLEDSNSLKRGNSFTTKEGTILVYIANNHKWFHVPKKLYDVFNRLKGKEVIIIGGSSGECLLDLEVCGLAMGVKVTRNEKYIYSATSCPIK